MRRAALAALLLATAWASADDGRLTVTYRSESAVYVDGGRSRGLAVGDRLNVVEGTAVVAELEVVFVAGSSASCRVVREERPVRKGAVVVKGAATATPSPAAAPSEPVSRDAVPPARAPSGAVELSSSRAQPPGPAVSGSIGAGVADAFDRSAQARSLHEQYARLDLAARGLAGRPIALRARASTRNVSRGAGGLAAPASERRDRVYEASVAWQPDRYEVRAGRLGAAPFVTVGFLDGVQAAVRPTPTVELGAFGGRVATLDGLGGESGAKLGGYLRLASSSLRLPWELVVSGAHENGSRDYLGLEVQARGGAAWMHGRAELDLNRGWRKERAGSAQQLSDLRLDAGWRASSIQTVSLSYDRHENVWARWNRDLPDWIVEPEPLHGLRLTWALMSRAGWGAGLGGTTRRLEGEDRTSWAAFGALRTARVHGLTAGLDATWSRTRFTDGIVATLRVGREFRGGHRLDLSYTTHRDDVVEGGTTRSSEWLRLSAYGALGRRGFVVATADYARGDDFEGPRLLAEVGTRF